MSDSPASIRRYTDREMAALLHRAAELQAQTDEGSHSLEDIQRIAVEVGVDPALVALMAETSAVERRWSRLLGPAPTVDSSTRVSGVPMVPVADVVHVIRSETGHFGETHEVGKGVEWRHASDYSIVHVSVSRRRTAWR